jgi:hypothetical protein
VALTATNVAQFAVALVYLGLAAWLLYLEFSRTIHRILALVFFLRGSAIVLNQFVMLDPTRAGVWHAVRVYFFIATAFAILDFLIVYTWRKPSAARRGGRLFLLGVAVIIESAYLLDHRLVAVLTSNGLRFGPMGFAMQMSTPLLAVAAVWFSLLARQARLPAQSRFHGLMALGFALAGLAEVATSVAVILTRGWERVVLAGGDTSGAVIAQLVLLSTVPISLVAIGIQLLSALAAVNRTRIAWILGTTAAVILLPLAVRLWTGNGDGHSALFFSAVPRGAAAFVIGYGLVRQVSSGIDVFALDLRAGIAFRSGTVGGILIALFFVVSEASAQIFSQFAATQNLNPVVAQLVGIAGAGLLLFFLHPLNRLGERLSTSVLPTARPAADLTDGDRLRIYEEQVELAWADGSITRKERLLLDRLREQLHLPMAEAAQLESRAALKSTG